MTSTTKSRREFLKSSGSTIGASWLAVNTPLILAACQSAQIKTETQAGYENLRPKEALELGAVVDQIIPPDETPGATETGVVYFIDVALGGFMAGSASTLRTGLEDLQRKATSVQGGNHQFSDLSFAQQTVVLKEAENTEFFGTLHFLTMMGMFCLPKYGGNRDHAGWDLIGFNHQHAWQPPFGYYDAAVHAQTLKQGDDHGHS